MSRQRVAALLAVCVGLVWVVATARGGDEKVGYVEGKSFTDGLREPSAVDVLEDGGVVVTDFAAQTVTTFEPGGAVRWRLEDGLDQPSGLGVAPDGVWVTDAGNHRLLFLDADDGEVKQEIGIDPELHPIDVAFDGKQSLWVSCTPEDVLLKLSMEGEVELHIDKLENLPMRAPRGLAATPDGGVVFVEALSGKVRRIGGNGKLMADLADWGMTEGAFVKPKDVTWLPTGGLAVLDTHQGILQLLDSDGTFEMAVTKEGERLFEHPLGVAAVRDLIYVADAGSSAVRVFKRGGPAYLGGRFERAQMLFREVSVRDDDPSPICRQCHDGTRRLSAGNFDPTAKNHPIQVQDEERAQFIPDNISRNADGSLKCTSCHQIHDQQVLGMVEDSEAVDFGLKPPQTRSLSSRQVCLNCHADYIESAPRGKRHTHPLGVPRPDEADHTVLDRARSRLDEDQLTCMSCHRPHGASEEPLLVLSSTDGTLCVSCHTDRTAELSQHPLDMEVSEAVATRVEDLGGVLGPDGLLTCMSCHDPHLSTGDTLLRAEGEDGGSPCESCHEERAAAIGEGRHGKVGCASCHGMHVAPDLDLEDLSSRIGPAACLACHTQGRSDNDAPQVSVRGSHPLGVGLGGRSDMPGIGGRMACSTCHNAHGAGSRLLRRKSIPDLCISCHSAQRSVFGSEHDAALVPVARSNTTCVSCHDAHGVGRGSMLVRIKPGENPANARCLSCHDGSTSAVNPGAFTHPSAADRQKKKRSGVTKKFSGKVTFYTDGGRPTRDLTIGIPACGTCHDPHRWKHDQAKGGGEAEGNDRTSFLRSRSMVLELCERCHGRDAEERFLNFHSQSFRDYLEVW